MTGFHDPCIPASTDRPSLPTFTPPSRGAEPPSFRDIAVTAIWERYKSGGWDSGDVRDSPPVEGKVMIGTDIVQQRPREGFSVDLTPTQIAVLGLLAVGETRKSISERLHLSARTVDNRLREIRRI